MANCFRTLSDDDLAYEEVRFPAVLRSCLATPEVIRECLAR